MFFIRFFTGLLLLLSLNVSYAAEYQITNGSSSNKISFNKKQCSSTAGSFLKNNLAENFKNNGQVYAEVFGENIKFKFDYPLFDLGITNDVYEVQLIVEHSGSVYDSSSSKLVNDLGGTKSFVSTKQYDGSYTLIIKLSEGSTSHYCLILNDNKPISINHVPTPQVPTITGVSNVSPLSAVSGSNFTFNCTTSTSLPLGYGIYLNLGDDQGFLNENQAGGHVNMGSDCSHTMPINTSGNRRFRVGIFDAQGNLVGSYSSAKSFTVTAPAVQHTPTLSITNSPVSEITLGSSYTIGLQANDQDGNLKTLDINWGDGNDATPASFDISGSLHSQNYPHTYQSVGTYTWTSVVKDHTSKVSNTVSRIIVVKAITPQIPTITGVSNASPLSAVSGSNFTFNCTTSTSLLSGYGIYLNLGDDQGFLNENQAGGHVNMGSDCSHTMPISTSGNRRFRVGIFDAQGNLVGNYSSAKSFTVTAPAVQHAPTLTVTNSPVSEVTLGSSYTIGLRANDEDGNLKTLDINWGDGNNATPASFEISGSIHSQNYPHTYQSVGAYTWTSTVYDHTSKASNRVTGVIVVKAATPVIITPPSGVSATDGAYTDKIRVSWNSVIGASKYKVYRSEVSSGSYSLLTDNAVSPYDDYSATTGITYYYKVKSYSSEAGDSNLSNNDSGYLDTEVSINSLIVVSLQGEGRVFSSPSNTIDCGSYCSHEYPQNSSVSLTAVAKTGWGFSHWQGYSACSTTAQCDISAQNDIEITAVFSEVSVVDIEPSLFDFSPKSIPKGETTLVTVQGANLPSAIVANINGTNGYCQTVSQTAQKLELNCIPSVAGEQRFYIKDEPSGSTIKGSEAWDINVTEPANTAPSVWVDPNYQKYTYVGDSYYIVAKSWDTEKNLKSIQVDWQANGIWNRLVTVSKPEGEDVSFSYTPTSVGILNIRFEAVDENGASTISETYTVQIQPKPVVVIEAPSTGTAGANSTKQKLAANCEGNPITTANGAKIENKSLLQVNGLLPINFNLQYNSLIRGKSSVGIGWDFANAHAAKIVENANGEVAVRWSQNKEHLFTINQDKSYSPNSPACRLDTLEKINGLFRLERSGREVFLFDEFNFLKRIENDKGQGLDFVYNQKSQLVKVVESVSGKFIEYLYDSNDYLTQAKTSGGHSVYLDYSNGRLIRITHSDGNIEEFTYTDLDQILTRSINGLILSSTQYDELGRAIEQDDTNTGNETLRLTYNETSSFITTNVVNRTGQQKVMVFDKDYKLIKKTDAVGNKTFYEYSDGGQPTRIIDAKGYETLISYNKYGDITQTIYPNNGVELREYDESRNLLKVTDPLQKSETSIYDENNNRLSVTDRLGNTTHFAYNSNNQLLSTTTPEGRETQYSYTGGLLTSITNPKGFVRYLEYDQDGRLIAESDFEYNYTRYILDAKGRKLSETDPLGNRQTWSYDFRGNVILYRDAIRNNPSHSASDSTRETRYVYNDEGDLIKIIKVYNTLETIWEYKYDGESRLIEEIDPNGNSTYYKRDALGRIVETTDALGNVTKHQYDANNNQVKETDPLGQQVISTYDSMNQLTGFKDALENQTSYNYDLKGRLGETTDALVRIWKNIYDDSSQLASVDHPGNLTSSQSYDKDSNVVSFSTPSGDTRTLDLDENASPTTETTADSVALQYQYTSNGLVWGFDNGRGQNTGYDYDLASRLTIQSDTVSTIRYKYDAGNNLKEVSENSKIIERQFDGLNRVTQYKEDGNKQRRILYEFGAGGNKLNLTRISYPQIADSKSGYPVNYSFDSLNRMKTVSSFKAYIVAASYEYDSKGRIIKLVRGNGTVLNLTYDAADRLIKSDDRSANGDIIVQQDYTYDAIGRLIREDIIPEYSPSEELLQTVSMTYTAGNHLQTKDGKTFDFDGDGNILEAEGQALQFNVRNQLIQSGDYSYTYNAEGHRIGRTHTVDGIQKTTSYVVNPHHQGLVQTLRETTDAGVVHDFIYGSTGLLSQFNRTENTHYYFHYDYRGSVVAVTDQQGEVVARYGYLPFGKQYTVEGDFDTPFGYNGRDGVVSDPNGLVYMRARYYSPDQRRFINKDPLRGEIADLGSLNRYAYVSGDPVNTVDPSGLCATSGQGSLSNGSQCNEGLFEGGSPYDTSSLTRTSFISSHLMPSEEAVKSVDYACSMSSTDCVIAKTSYVVMEACFGTLEGELGGALLKGASLLNKGVKVDQYALKASGEGFYPVMTRGFKEPQGGVFLKAGDVWKYGTTKNPSTRYTQKYLYDLNLYYKKQSINSLNGSLKTESYKIIEYKVKYGQLPPGNKIIK